MAKKPMHRIVDNYVRAQVRRDNAIAPGGYEGSSTKDFREGYSGGRKALERDAKNYAMSRAVKHLNKHK